jgi:adenine-specific DNA-methyltransferase
MSLEKITRGDEQTKSLDLVNDNINKLRELFPEIVTEGQIDFKVLQEILGEELEEGEEFYRFTWAGKAQARREAHKPSTGTLRPCKEESMDWDATQNLYIEGDNLEVLKLMQKSYANKVKMIYIDPPYNTGKDFVYKDNYKDNLKNYQQVTGQVDDEGNKLSTNSDSDGRYHSNWLNMIYPRLRLARNLLKDDGVIFISIGEAEVSNLKNICNEIFGEINSVGLCSRMMKSGSNQGKFFSANIDYVLVYAKNINFLNEFRERLSDDLIKKVYNQIETEGERKGEKFRTMGLYQSSLEERINQRFWIKCPDGTLCIPDGDSLPEKLIDGEKVIPKAKEGVWRWTYERYVDELKKGNIEFKKTKDSPLIDENRKKSNWNIYTKIWLKDRQEEGKIPSDLITKFENRHSSKEIQSLEIPFDFAKPIGLIEFLLEISQIDSNEIVLDFFGGSSTTAHSVIKWNLEANKKIKYILVQLPELTDVKSEAYKLGYKKITEIGKERIRRAGSKIVEENPDKAKDLDLGFKVFKLDSSNIKGWDGNPEDIETSLFEAQENIKAERTEEDVLFEILLKYGLDLTLPIDEKLIEGKKVFSVGFGALFICLADDITNKVAEGIGAWKQELNPATCRVIFKDGGFTDVEKTNAVQTLKRFGVSEIKSI